MNFKGFGKIRVITVQSKLKFEPRDMWVGLYWKRYGMAIDLYFCLIPCVPFNVYIQWFE